MDDMIIIFCGPRRPLSTRVRLALTFFVCGLILFGAAVEFNIFLEIIGKTNARHATHHAH